MANFSISFSPNGGGPVSPASIPITAGTAVGQLPDPPRRQGSTLGHRFVGWHTPFLIGWPATMLTENTIAPNHYLSASARWELNIDSRRNLSFWWQSNDVPVRQFDVDSYWQTAMERGISNWNDSDAPVNFTISSSSVNFVAIGHREWEALGRIYYQLRIGRSLYMFRVVLNTTNIENHAERNGYVLGNVITSVMAHELGHAVGLEDNPPTENNNSLMLTGNRRSRNTVMGPTDFDIESVEIIYD